MIKIVALIRAKPELTPAAFRDYYETRHVPLVRSMLPGMKDYRRNFLSWDETHLVRGPADRNFDAITEVWFEDQAAFDAFKQAFSDPRIKQRIEDDEDNFLDRQSVQILIVDETRSLA
jgi:uncharacterized protein (TIGR02118 family)